MDYLACGLLLAFAIARRRMRNKTTTNEDQEVIDFNKWQATGRSQEVMAIDPFKKKWQAFGWSAYEVDGHDIGEIDNLFSKLPDGSGKPVAIIAHTIKGKGVSFMEDNNNWHYRTPKPEEVQAAKRELGLV